MQKAEKMGKCSSSAHTPLTLPEVVGWVFLSLKLYKQIYKLETQEKLSEIWCITSKNCRYTSKVTRINHAEEFVCGHMRNCFIQNQGFFSFFQIQSEALPMPVHSFPGSRLRHYIFCQSRQKRVLRRKKVTKEYIS